MCTILIVDDDEAILATLALHLTRAGHEVVQANSAFAALAWLDQGSPDLIISDVNMPRMDGMELCMRVRARQATADVPFLFLTARGESRDKLEGLKIGADDYVTKPFDRDDLLARVNGRLQHRARLRAFEQERGEAASPKPLDPAESAKERAEDSTPDRGRREVFTRFAPPQRDPEDLRQKVSEFEQRFPGLAEIRRTKLIGEHPRMLQLFESIVIAASTSDPTLIVGETGVGKTGVAEAIAALSARGHHPLRTMNCAELAAGDATIALGRLFGYGKHHGLTNIPPTGRPGVLEDVDGGTLFLDEVAVLPTQAQTALLLPLEGRGFHPAVGTGPARHVDVKFIFATNVDLGHRADTGEFPRDLYERIADEVVYVPALRERAEDIPILARCFLDQVAGPDAGFDRHADAALASHTWPGNVRELRRIVRAAWRRASLDGRTTVHRDDLPFSATVAESLGVTGDDTRLRASDAASDFTEREYADLQALQECGFHIGEASDQLGLSRSSRTLSHRLRGMCFKALCLRQWDVDRAAEWLAGGDPELIAIAARKVRDQVDRMNSRLDAEPDVHTRHLLADHCAYAQATLEYLRTQRVD